MRRRCLFVVALCALSVAWAWAQDVELLPPRDLGRWGMPSGNYSGITPLGGGCYAVVSDKEVRDGFFVFCVVQDSLTGQVTDVRNEGFRGVETGLKGGRDAEGVAFTPDDSLVWVSGEADQRIVAYQLDGTMAGRELYVPPFLGRTAIYPNYGFEALGYDSVAGLFWTMPENVLKADGQAVVSGVTHRAGLRLQSFGRDGHPRTSHIYMLDAPQSGMRGRQYAFGAVAICPAGDGRLWVMEREINVPKRRLRSRVYTKIYEVVPREGLMPDTLEKRPVAAFVTRMRLFRPKLANYEGLCEGARLADGRRTWLLLSDSQGGYGHKLCHLRDWIRVMVQGDGGEEFSQFDD